MQLPYYMGLHNTTFGRYLPCNKAIAFYISITAPKYAINPYMNPVAMAIVSPWREVGQAE